MLQHPYIGASKIQLNARCCHLVVTEQSPHWDSPDGEVNLNPQTLSHYKTHPWGSRVMQLWTSFPVQSEPLGADPSPGDNVYWPQTPLPPQVIHHDQFQCLEERIMWPLLALFVYHLQLQCCYMEMFFSYTCYLRRLTSSIASFTWSMLANV